MERRIVGSSWQKALRIAHTKLSDALDAERPALPAIDTILPAGRSQQGTTYFDCVRVLAALKEAGLDEKSFLGQFTNPHTARWAEVVRRFESGAVYLIDAAHFLVHGCSYELPALKKEIGRAERELAELQRRQTEYTRLAEASRARFVAACTKRQIAPEETAAGLRDELRLSISQLRPIYQKVARIAQLEPLPSAVREYKALVGYSLDKVEEPAAAEASGGKAAAASKAAASKGGKKAKGGKAAAEAEAAEVATSAAASEVAAVGESGEIATALLPLISRVQAIDLSKVDLSASPSGAAASVEASGAIEIDWGGGGDGGGAGGVVEVDWGGDMEVATAGEGVIEVDWGADAAATGAAAAIEVDWGGGGGEIAGAALDMGPVELEMGDFEFEVEESGEGMAAEELSLAAIFEQSDTRNQARLPPSTWVLARHVAISAPSSRGCTLLPPPPSPLPSTQPLAPRPLCAAARRPLGAAQLPHAVRRGTRRRRCGRRRRLIAAHRAAARLHRGAGAPRGGL